MQARASMRATTGCPTAKRGSGAPAPADAQAVIIALGLIPAETFRRGDKTIAAT